MKKLQFIVIRILLVSQFLTIVSSEKKRYDNFTVFSVNIETSAQLDVVLNLNSNYEFSFWNGVQIGRSADIMVSPNKIDEFLNYTNQHQLISIVKINNVQELIDKEKLSIKRPDDPTSDIINWTAYQTLDLINEWLDQLLTKYPKVLTNFVIGLSYENRAIRGILLSHKPGNKIIFIDSTIHAREWIATATATWILNELLTSTDPEVISLVTNYDWFIVPVLNVDGYVYTHEHDRLWRKTRQPFTTNCTGADPNRNFNYFWRQSNGASDDPCSIFYAGPRAESEPEVRQFSRFVENMKSRIKLYYTFHSYGQMLLTPFGHTLEKPPNYNDLMTIGLEGQKAISKRYQTKYAVGTFAEVLYIASGSSVDWAYGGNNIALAYTYEFRDDGTHGFLLPAEEIIPNSLEVFDGIKAMILAAKDLGYL